MLFRSAPEVTRERLYLDAMEEVMANNSKVVMDTQNSGNLMYLPLDKLMSGSGGSSMNSGLPTSNLGATSNTRNVLEEFNRNTSRSRVRETR